MKTIAVFALACFALVANAGDEKPGADAVVVKVLDKTLPSVEVWEQSGKETELKKFDSYTTDRWKENFSLFAKGLVQKAGDQKLDWASLSNALDLVLKDSDDKIAYLPIGAYQTTKDGKAVWIITVKWEYLSFLELAEMVKDSGYGSDVTQLRLGHFRMFAFDQKTLKREGYFSCG